MSKTGTHLIVHQGALGDFLLALRLAERLEGRVVMATTGARVGLLKRFGGWGVEGVDVEGRGWGKMHGRVSLEREFGGFSGSFGDRIDGFCDSIDGVLVSFVSNGADAWAENAKRVFGRARLVFVKGRPDAGYEGHVTAWQGAQLEAQAGEWLGRCERFKGVWECGRGVVMHPGSGGAGKRWPLERFAGLSRRLRKMGVGVRWVVSPDDLEMDRGGGLAGCLKEFDGEVVESLVRLAEVGLGAGVWVGNDSGPSHLMGMLGVPSVVLFGPTDARVWGPVGERVKVVAPGEVCGMEWLGEEEVLEVIRDKG
jgi:heptosyltransferase III